MERVSVDEVKAMMQDDYKALRREYTKMRDIAQKRIKRLGESEFSYTKAYQEHREGFKKLKDISKGDFAKAFSELSKFVNAKGSSVSGQKEIRAKTIKTWNEQGIPINTETYKRTITILEEMRKRKVTYGSDVAQDLARITMELSDSLFYDVLDEMELYLQHTDELENYLSEVHGMVDLSDFEKMIGG